VWLWDEVLSSHWGSIPVNDMLSSYWVYYCNGFEPYFDLAFLNEESKVYPQYQDLRFNKEKYLRVFPKICYLEKKTVLKISLWINSQIYIYERKYYMNTNKPYMYNMNIYYDDDDDD